MRGSQNPYTFYVEICSGGKMTQKLQMIPNQYDNSLLPSNGITNMIQNGIE